MKYVLTLELAPVDVERELEKPAIRAKDYEIIGVIRDFGKVVKLEAVED